MDEITKLTVIHGQVFFNPHLLSKMVDVWETLTDYLNSIKSI